MLALVSVWGAADWFSEFTALARNRLHPAKGVSLQGCVPSNAHHKDADRDDNWDNHQHLNVVLVIGWCVRKNRTDQHQQYEASSHQPTKKAGDDTAKKISVCKFRHARKLLFARVRHPRSIDPSPEDSGCFSGEIGEGAGGGGGGAKWTISQ